MEINNLEIPQNDLPKASPSGVYKVENVILLESNFSRKVSIDLGDRIITNEINIFPEAHEATTENKFGVTLTLDYTGRQNDIIVCSSKIRMIGIFEKTGEPALAEDAFKKINAPAIIYPFIREHLYNICLKAGIANVLLPTVNFKI